AAGVVLGGAVWALHFLAMLAYRPGLPAGYDVGLTVASVVLVMGMAAAGFALARRGRGALAVAGGAVVGLGIAAMHYAGMAALEVQARAGFRPGFVLASVAAAVALSAP